MAKLLARECTVSLTDYGVVTGTPTAGTAVPVCALARSVREGYTTEEIDQTALCDEVRSTIPGQSDITLDIELYVPDTGLILRALRGHWVRVIIDPDGAGTLGTITIDGSLLTGGYDLSVGESQIERATIRQSATAF